MIKATYKHPPMQTKTVWAGLYGGHYDIIVFFSEKPVPNTRYMPGFDEGQEWYCCSENETLIIGDMSLPDFYRCFPDADLRPYTQPREDQSTLGGRALEIEIPEVFQIEITTCFDEHGYMEQFKFKEDW